RFLARREILLEDRPVVGVVDVAGRVHLGRPEPPIGALGILRRLGVPQPNVGVAAAGALLVGLDEGGRKAHRPASIHVEADPEGDGLDGRHLAAYRVPALGREAADPAAEGADLEVLAEAGEALDPDPRATHDPGALALEAGVHQVGVAGV